MKMKRNYLKPQCMAVKIETTRILAGSSIEIENGEGAPTIGNPYIIQSKGTTIWEESEE